MLSEVEQRTQGSKTNFSVEISPENHGFSESDGTFFSANLHTKEGSDDSDLEVLEIHEIGNQEDAEGARLETFKLDTNTEQKQDHKNGLNESNNIPLIYLSDEEEDLLEYDHDTPKPETVAELHSKTPAFLSVPIILQTGNFPYLLAPLTNDQARRHLPEEYDDAIILFDDGIALNTSIHDIFERIRKTFMELDNPFGDDVDLVLNFKELNLSLTETNIHSHKLILSDVIEAFNSIVNNSIGDTPQCLHMDLKFEESFLSKFNKIKGQLKVQINSLNPESSVIIDSDSDSDSETEELTGNVHSDASPFELDEDEIIELDKSLTPEETTVNSDRDEDDQQDTVQVDVDGPTENESGKTADTEEKTTKGKTAEEKTDEKFGEKADEKVDGKVEEVGGSEKGIEAFVGSSIEKNVEAGSHDELDSNTEASEPVAELATQTYINTSDQISCPSSDSMKRPLDEIEDELPDSPKRQK